MAFTYQQLKNLRTLLLDEVKTETPVLTTEHYILVEARIANIIIAVSSDSDVKTTLTNLNLLSVETIANVAV